MNHFVKKMAVCITAGALMASMALAQAPAAPPQGGGAPPAGGAPRGGGGGGRGPQAPLAVPNPKYMSTRMEIEVTKPAAEVWARVGKYCDIGEWFGGIPCTLLSGKDGEVGTVRSVGNEILVSKTDLSYTYTQPTRVDSFYDLYHGILEAKPVTATTSKLIYTLMWDASNLADDAAREADKTRRTTQFTGYLNNMKILAEGGTLPARGGRGGGAPGGAPGGGAGRGQRQ